MTTLDIELNKLIVAMRTLNQVVEKGELHLSGRSARYLVDVGWISRKDPHQAKYVATDKGAFVYRRYLSSKPVFGPEREYWTSSNPDWNEVVELFFSSRLS